MGFQNQIDVDDKIERLKDMLLVKCYIQKEWIDYK